MTTKEQIDQFCKVTSCYCGRYNLQKHRWLTCPHCLCPARLGGWTRWQFFKRRSSLVWNRFRFFVSDHIRSIAYRIAP